MAKGRMIARALAKSKKFAKCPPRCGILYALSMAHTNLEGRLEADDESLLDTCGRYARAQDWTEETVAADREHLGRVGLWIVYGPAGGELAQVVDFHAHNRTDPRDEPPSDLPPPDGYSDEEERRKHGRPPYHKRQSRKGLRRTSSTPGRNSIGTGAELRKGKGKGQGQVQGEGKGKGPPAAGPSPTEDHLKPLRALVEMIAPTPAELATHKIAPVEPGGERVAVELAKDLSRLYNLPPQDGRVVADAEEWARDRWRLNAAVQVLERLEDPDERRRLTNPVGYMRRAVEDRAKELKERHHNEIENVLDRGERQRHAEAASRPVPYDPTA
jgi:hypothetical protein